MPGDDPKQPDQPTDPIPLGESSAAPPPPPRKPTAKPGIDAESLIKLVEDMPCPKCGAKMSHDAVVCMKCGYDMTAGRVQQTNVGPAVEVEAPAEIPEYSKPGKLDSLALTIIGALLLAGAMFAAGYFGAGDSANRAARVGLTALEALIHTGTGLIAVATAAFLTKMRFGRVDLAAARVFVALSSFLLLTRLQYAPAEPSPTITGLITFAQWVGAMGLYWALIMGLFWKKPNEAGLMAGTHLALYLGLSVLVWVESWLTHVAYTLAPAVSPTGTGP